MTLFDPTLRLMNQASPELEWKYLVNETLVGEKAIVPLIQDLLRSDLQSDLLAENLKHQLDEEVEHVRVYYQLVGGDHVLGSGYDVPLKSYVRSLPSVTLKIFALQAMLEGVALGALDYRLSAWGNSPSCVTDARARSEELGHIECSFNTFSELIEIEGMVASSEFRKVAQDINLIFVRAFNGEVIAKVMSDAFGVEVAPSQIEASPGLKKFRRKSAETLTQVKRRFIDVYSCAAENAAK